MKKGTIIGLSIGAGVLALAAVAAGYICYTMKALDSLNFDNLTLDGSCDCDDNCKCKKD